VWGDINNWLNGNWLNGKGPYLNAPPALAIPLPGTSYQTFPTLAGLGWPVKFTPEWQTKSFEHISGRKSRAARRSQPVWEIELTINLLRSSGAVQDFQVLAGFFEQCQGQRTPFWFLVPAELQGTIGASKLLCRFAADDMDADEFMAQLFKVDSLKLRSVKSE
jgi:hypothetical protein